MTQRQRAYDHYEKLNPKLWLLNHPHKVALNLEIFCKIFLVDQAQFNLLLYKLFVEHNRIFEVLPNTLKVPLEDNSNATHKWYETDDQIRKEAILR